MTKVGSHKSETLIRLWKLSGLKIRANIHTTSKIAGAGKAAIVLSLAAVRNIIV